MGMVCGRNSKRVKRDRYSGYIEDSEKVSSKQSILQLEGMGVKESQENKKSPKNDFSPKKAKIRGIEDTWIEKFNMNRLNNPLLPSGGLEDFQNLLDTQESQEFVYIPKNRDIQDFESYCRSYPSTSFSNHWKIAVQKYSKLMVDSNRLDDMISRNIASSEMEAIEHILELNRRRWYSELSEIEVKRAKPSQGSLIDSTKFDKMRLEIEQHFKFAAHCLACKVLNLWRSTYTSDLDNNRVYKERMRFPNISAYKEDASVSYRSTSQKYNITQSITSNFLNRNSVGEGSYRDSGAGEIQVEGTSKRGLGMSGGQMKTPIFGRENSGHDWKTGFFSKNDENSENFTNNNIDKGFSTHILKPFHSQNPLPKKFIHEIEEGFRFDHLKGFVYRGIYCRVIFPPEIEKVKKRLERLKKVVVGFREWSMATQKGSTTSEVVYLTPLVSFIEKGNIGFLVMPVLEQGNFDLSIWTNETIYEASINQMVVQMGLNDLDILKCRKSLVERLKIDFQIQPIFGSFKYGSFNMILPVGAQPIRSLLDFSGFYFDPLSNKKGYFSLEHMNLEFFKKKLRFKITKKSQVKDFLRYLMNSVLVSKNKTRTGEQQKNIIDSDSGVNSNQTLLEELVSYKSFNIPGTKNELSIAKIKYKYSSYILIFDPHSAIEDSGSLFSKAILSYFYRGQGNTLKIKGVACILQVRLRSQNIVDVYQRLTQKQSSQKLRKILKIIETCDRYYSFEAIRALLKSHGMPSTFVLLMYIICQEPRTKTFLGVMIFCKILKFLIKKSENFIFGNTSMVDEVDMHNFVSGTGYRKTLSYYLNYLLSLSSEAVASQKDFFGFLRVEFALLKLNLQMDSEILLSKKELITFMSKNLFLEIILTPYKELSLFMEGMTNILRINFAKKVKNTIRNDKFCLYLPPYLQKINHSLIKGPLSSHFSLMDLRNYAYLNLDRVTSKKLFQYKEMAGGLQAPCTFYRGAEWLLGAEPQHSISEEEITDWLLSSESVLLSSLDVLSDQSVILELYAYQIISQIFSKNTDGARKLLDNMQNQMDLNSIVESGTVLSFYILSGVSYELGNLQEAVQMYGMGLILCHKMYGDPRGRGCRGRVLELFIVWRLSIIYRMEGLQPQAEYVESLFDAVLSTLASNSYNSYFGVFEELERRQFGLGKAQIDLKSTLQKLRGLSPDEIHEGDTTTFKPNPELRHPFSHWMDHKNLVGNVEASKVLQDSVLENPELRNWLFLNLPIFSQEKSSLWHSGEVKKLFYNFYQTSIPLESGHQFSVDSETQTTAKHKIKDILGSLERQGSTVSYKELFGSSYSWGMNSRGQLGSLPERSEGKTVYIKRKNTVSIPRLVLPLKNVLVSSVSCGYAHTLAVTSNGDLLAWGSNSSCQLGIGKGVSASYIGVPLVVDSLTKVRAAFCGSEHSMAICRNGALYSWGSGTGGVLGHGDEVSQSSPKNIEFFGKNIKIQQVAVGGLHNLVLDKQGKVYSWGRGEAGQLGVYSKVRELNGHQEIFLTSPVEVKGFPQNSKIVKIAAGDAHSLALTNTQGVFGWGFTSNGQLGTGETAETTGMNSVKLMVKYPRPIDTLSKMNIVKVFCGATSSFFMSKSGSIYAMGLNDMNQLAMRKQRPISGKMINFEEVAHPLKVSAFKKVRVSKIYCGSNHSIAVGQYNSTKVVVSWGQQKQRQLGRGKINKKSSLPGFVQEFDDCKIKSVGCGAYHSVLVLGAEEVQLDTVNFQRCKRLIDAYGEQEEFLEQQSQKI